MKVDREKGGGREGTAFENQKEIYLKLSESRGKGGCSVLRTFGQPRIIGEVATDRSPREEEDHKRWSESKPEESARWRASSASLVNPSNLHLKGGSFARRGSDF